MLFSLLLATMATEGVIFGAPTGDLPDARHAWAVHDRHRPEPMKVDVPSSGIPSDAVVLFDGSEESVRKNWCDEQGNPTKWTVKDGLFVCTPRSGGAYTREHFGDCQLHVEFRIPNPPGEGHGNSGVILQSRYELQVLDCHSVIPTADPRERAWTHGDYADGQIGAVYGQHPPLVNACRAPGEWQTYDIIFHPPLEKDGELVDSGSMTALLNGTVVQDAWPLEGRVQWRFRPLVNDRVAEGPLRLQDHGHPVAYRNIWLRRIPSRFAETTNGGPGVKPEDVAAKRRENAEKTLAWAATLKDPAKRVMAYAEAWGYQPTPENRRKLDKAAADYVKNAKPGYGMCYDFKYFLEMCERCGLFNPDSEFLRHARAKGE